LGKQGGKKISIPMPSITIPRFTHGDKDMGGVGQGPGEPGQGIGDPQDGGGTGPGAGDAEVDHALSVEFSVEELAQMLGEELELPRIEPKGIKEDSTKDRYTSIRQQGPESLRHFGRTFKKALRRQIAAGTYNPKRPVIIPRPEDKQYRAAKELPLPHHDAVIFTLMDISGSMGEEQREIIRIITYWIDIWLRSQYNKLQTRWIVHDHKAKEVDYSTFFRITTGGGTRISSAYELTREIIHKDYPVEDWNIYIFQFSDGDNLSSEDNRKCMNLLTQKLLPVSNSFCYGQTDSPYGSGKFILELEDAFPVEDKVILSRMEDKGDIMKSIKDFLGKGR